MLIADPSSLRLNKSIPVATCSLRLTMVGSSFRTRSDSPVPGHIPFESGQRVDDLAESYTREPDLDIVVCAFLGAEGQVQRPAAATCHGAVRPEAWEPFGRFGGCPRRPGAITVAWRQQMPRHDPGTARSRAAMSASPGSRRWARFRRSNVASRSSSYCSTNQPATSSDISLSIA